MSPILVSALGFTDKKGIPDSISLCFLLGFVNFTLDHVDKIIGN